LFSSAWFLGGGYFAERYTELRCYATSVMVFLRGCVKIRASEAKNPCREHVKIAEKQGISTLESTLPGDVILHHQTQSTNPKKSKP
jgi:hypothetical protein